MNALRVFLTALMALVSTPAFAGVEQRTWGAVKELYRGAEPDASTAVPQEPSKTGGSPQTAGWVAIAWPFGPAEDPAYWRGDEGDRTGGGSVTACGGIINSHSRADYYARDLSRTNASTWGRPVYAGITGVVIRARFDGGYGNSVVIWNPISNIQVRYSHLASFSAWEGMYVSVRQYIGRVGNTSSYRGYFDPHLHLVVYQGIPVGSNGLPQVGYVCMSSTYARPCYFFC